ncbi:MAG: hypothetical protein ABEJ47_01305 [Halorhabdus sp.]
MAISPRQFVNGTSLKAVDLALVIIGGIMAAFGVGYGAIIGTFFAGLRLLVAGPAAWIAAFQGVIASFIASVGSVVWAGAASLVGFFPAMLQPLVAIGLAMFILYAIYRGLR